MKWDLNELAFSIKYSVLRKEQVVEKVKDVLDQSVPVQQLSCKDLNYSSNFITLTETELNSLKCNFVSRLKAKWEQKKSNYERL